jgi:hypothetical protein
MVRFCGRFREINHTAPPRRERPDVSTFTCGCRLQVPVASLPRAQCRGPEALRLDYGRPIDLLYMAAGIVLVDGALYLSALRSGG